MGGDKFNFVPGRVIRGGARTRERERREAKQQRSKQRLPAVSNDVTAVCVCVCVHTSMYACTIDGALLLLMYL